MTRPGMVRGETPRRGLKGPSSSSSVAKHPDSAGTGGKRISPRGNLEGASRRSSNPTVYYFEHGKRCVCVACRATKKGTR